MSLIHKYLALDEVLLRITIDGAASVENELTSFDQSDRGIQQRCGINEYLFSNYNFFLTSIT